MDGVGLAFVLVVAAGLSTCLGAALVFISPVTDTRMLSGALGASAGVMTYVAMMELFAVSAIDSFQKAGLSSQLAMRYATLAFFGGMLATWLLDKAIHGIHTLPRLCAAAVEHLQRMWRPAAAPAAGKQQPDMEFGVMPCSAGEKAAAVDLDLDDAGPPPSDSEGLQPADCLDHADLHHLGLLTALVITLHNVPEGLATFVSTMASPSAGAAMAIAVGLHNMPEGIMVAMPIYYATGSKWRGFAWAALSACAEPLGGLLGFLVLSYTTFSPLGFAIVFASVAGMMVYISMRELLPTALKYDREDRVTTLSLVWGMAVIAASLLLFSA